MDGDSGELGTAYKLPGPNSREAHRWASPALTASTPIRRWWGLPMAGLGSQCNGDVQCLDEFVNVSLCGVEKTRRTSSLADAEMLQERQS
jgi:hypothetical protein